MKTANLLLLGGLAFIGYKLFKGSQSDAGYVGGGGGFSEGVSMPEPANVSIVKPTGERREVSFSTAAEGLPLINAALQGVQIDTGARTITPSSPNRSSPNYNTSVQKLATGETVKIQVKQAATDAQGKTAFDRLIEKNRKAYAAR